ncbi:HAMP domain-containing protein [Streptomyces sp. XM4193]|uniref:HAMP domain-containing protein n=1 Tax=Streptomyces sp. XM4193 TaxID=2929782 RepID=UPI001FFB4F1A|nr:HAMP domain-containing protein [Streptomyces sp. XM4193]MCK1795553.1 HAMP domain-containing protein [Streptomyces sp. XM4193]
MSLLGGIRPPIAALSALLLALAGTTALSLGSVEDKALPEAVLTSQQHIAEDAAVSLRSSLDETVTDLRRVTGHLSSGRQVSADEVLDAVGETNQRRRGSAVVDLGSGRLLAARGEAVPLNSFDARELAERDEWQPKLVELAGGEHRLLSFGLLAGPGQEPRLAVTTNSLRLPDSYAGGGTGGERSARVLTVVDERGETVGAARDRDARSEHRQNARAFAPAPKDPQAPHSPQDPRQDPEDGSDAVTAAHAADPVRASGKDPSPSADQLASFSRQAVERTAGPASGESGAGVGFPGPSGHLLGERTGGERGDRAVAGYARLTAPPDGPKSPAGELGLTVLAMTAVGETASAGIDPLYGLFAAGALLGVGALTIWLLVALVQRPLLGLFLESRRLARGELGRPVAVPRFGEAARVGRALESLRRQLLGDRDRDGDQDGDGDENGRGDRDGRRDATRTRTPRRRPGARALLVLCGVLMLVWCAPLAALVNRADTDGVPPQLVSDQRDRTGTVSDRVRRALNEGHSDLASVARLVDGRAPQSRLVPLLERTMHEHQRYESLYVLDARGNTVAHTGSSPTHPEGRRPAPSGLAVLGEGGRVPVVAGYAPVSGARGLTVVGEFRIAHLNALLTQPGLGQVRLVDERERVIGGSSGFVAFEQLDDSRLSALMAESRTPKSGAENGRSTAHEPSADSPAGENRSTAADPAARPAADARGPGGDRRIAAAAPVLGGGPADNLGWSTVSWQAPDGLALPAYQLENRTVLVGLLGLTATVACLGWLHIVVVRPLRELVGRAEALADGDRRTVLFPRHHDEVGAITRSLEIVRQRLQEQHKRGGAAAVPAGRN